MTQPTPAPVESKVKWASVAAFVAGVLVAVLNTVQDNPGLIAALPKWAQALIIAIAPALVTFLSGYAAPHTSR